MCLTMNIHGFIKAGHPLDRSTPADAPMFLFFFFLTDKKIIEALFFYSCKIVETVRQLFTYADFTRVRHIPL